MTVLTTFSNGGTLKDFRETFNAMLASIVSLQQGGGAGASTPVTTIAASGAARTLTAAAGSDPAFDVTLTADCTFALQANGTGRLQTITLYLRQDATAGRAVSLPADVIWPGGFVPQLNVLAGRIDVLQFATIDGVTWLGSIVASGAVASVLNASVQAGTIYAGSAFTVSGSYIGTAPTNFQVQINGGVWTTLPAGAATISNGLFNFSVTAPGAGAATIRVRALNTGATSPVIAFNAASGAPVVVAPPAHYLTSDASHNAYVYPSPTTNEGADGYLDIIVWIKANSYTVANELFSRWPGSGSTTNTNARYLMSLGANGRLFLAWYDNGANNFRSATATAALSASSATTPDTNSGVFLRVQLNVGAVDVTTVAGSAVAKVKVGECVFSAAVPSSANPASVAWTQVGATLTGLGSGGITQTTDPLPAVGTLSSSNLLNGRVYKLVVRNGAGQQVLNPDFTALATGTTSFDDGAGNSWSASAGAIA